MKKPALRHKARRSLRGGVTFLLAALILVTCSLPPARGAELSPEPGFGEELPIVLEETPVPEWEPSGEEPSGEEPSEEDPSGEEAAGESSREEASGQGEEEEKDPSEKDPSQEEEEEPSQPEETVTTFTVTFDMGPLGKEEFLVEEGQYLPEYPEEPSLPAAEFLGWFNEEGVKVPTYQFSSLRPSRNMTFTAKFSRVLEEVLNTQDHTAYISGYENGMFKPQRGVTRGEAAKMFYSLLLDQELEEKSFSDVPESKWYAQAVGVISALGIVSGYPDGTFRAEKFITRAEFVKMAAGFDTLVEGEVSFQDVKADSWAAPYIASALEKGWINGFSDNTFRPGDLITRAQAVTVLNHMLGRTPDTHIKEKADVKNFYDVFPDYWAYADIEEAATSHEYSLETGEEVWTSYEPDLSSVQTSHWVQDGQDRYYLDAKSQKFLRGKTTIDGVSYQLDKSTGKALTGFFMEGNWRRYYKNGLIQNDISGLGLVTGPYFIRVYKPANYLIVFAKHNGHFNTPVKAMRVSCGYGTPTGTYYTPSRYRWLQMVGDTWAQWCTQISGNYLFHSVPNWTHSNMDLEVDEYNRLGETRSLGCIRLNCRDAKWIYDNCALGTEVYISPNETSGPLPKPGGIQIPSWHTWDPTDPTAAYRCVQAGCHH